MKILALTLFLIAAASAESTDINIDGVVDDVLTIIRNSDYLKKKFPSISYPNNINEDGITVKNIVISNILDIFRAGESDVNTDIVNTTITVGVSMENLSMTSQWSKKIVFTMSGEVDFNFPKISVEISIEIEDFKKFVLKAFEVTDIDDMVCTKFTGASAIFNDLIKGEITKIMNGKKSMIKDQIETEGRKIFEEMFGETEKWLFV